MSGNEVVPSSAELARKIFLFCPESVGHKIVLAKRAPKRLSWFYYKPSQRKSFPAHPLGGSFFKAKLHPTELNLSKIEF